LNTELGEQVRRAFKRKALETHPDKLLASDHEKKAAEARFCKVREAFEVLNDPQKRRVRSVPIIHPIHL
jgi:curved DNA-binding protein CbpA